jgi:hypothetical protein
VPTRQVSRRDALESPSAEQVRLKLEHLAEGRRQHGLRPCADRDNLRGSARRSCGGKKGGSIKRTAVVTTFVTLVLATAGSANAANKNAITLHFTCAGGISFTGTSIAQNNAIVVQTSGETSRTFILTNVTEDNGVVHFNVPGFEDQETLACRIEEFPRAVFTGFFAPRSG